MLNYQVVLDVNRHKPKINSISRKLGFHFLHKTRPLISSYPMTVIQNEPSKFYF